MKALIVGGGIGGLTAAIALQRVGIEAHVYERVARPREAGAGISLWWNAVRALEMLGLADQLRARGWRPVRSDLKTWRGDVLVRGISEADAARRDVAIGVMHRADLLSMLMGEVDPAHLHTDRHCTGFVSDSTGVTAQFARAESARGDLLIGADGLHSIVRAQLFGASPPRYAGYTAWRSVVDFRLTPLVASESWGRGRRFGIVPLDERRVYWFATDNATEHEHDPNESARARLRRMFRGWHAPIEALIDASDESDVLRNDIYDRDPLARWTEGRVTLLGDAAHPMTPNLGQGACQAIEDALVLAVSLATPLATPGTRRSIDAALRGYDARRIPRTSRIVGLSRRLGSMAQWSHPIACAVRDLAMRATPAAVAERQLRSIVATEVLTNDERAMIAGAHPRAG